MEPEVSYEYSSQGEQINDEDTWSMVDMWEKSNCFRLFISINTCLFVFLLGVLFVSCNTYRLARKRENTVKDYIVEYTNKEENCQYDRNNQTAILQSLIKELDSANKFIDELQEAILNLQRAIIILDEDSVMLEEETIEIKKVNSLWYVIAGTSASVGIISSLPALYVHNLHKNCLTNLRAINESIYVKEDQISKGMKAIADNNFMVINNYTIIPYQCYNSAKSKYNKALMIANCSGYNGAGTIIEIETINGKLIGMYTKEGLPKDETNVYDTKAFIYILSEGVIAHIKNDVRSFAFTKNSMFTIGDKEIIISSSSEDTTTVKVDAGNSFEMNKNLYDDEVTFKIKSLKVYNLKVMKH